MLLSSIDAYNQKILNKLEMDVIENNDKTDKIHFATVKNI